MSVHAAPAVSRSDQTAHDSLVIGACTALSRATGVVRVIVIGAVLGPTFLGNAFQVTNSLPNLIYFGFLAGSLFSSLLVPALVPHVDESDPRRAALVSGGFLGVAWVALLPMTALAVLLLPELLGLAMSQSASPTIDPRPVVRLLVLLTVPQVFLYAVVGSAAAVMNAHRRFALASAAPAVENLGVIAVLAATGLIYGSGSQQQTMPPVGELLLLGLGSTTAVMVHAGLQWWGARRNGVVIHPRAGWREPQVVAVIRRSLRSVAQAGLLAVQVLTILILASRAGGSVSMQLGLNFYYLPIALVATPVGLALLPSLSRLHLRRSRDVFGRVFVDGLGLAMFLTIPAAVGYVLLSGTLAQVVSLGPMSTDAALRMSTESIAALAFGLVGQTIFFLSTQAAYARGDTGTPLRSMSLQAAICLALCGATLWAPSAFLNGLLGASYAVASLVAGAHLLLRVGATDRLPFRPFAHSIVRATVGSGLMALLVWPTVWAVDSRTGGRAGQVLALLLGATVGVVAYLLSQAALRSPELQRLRSAVRRHQSPLVGSGDAR